MAGRAALCARAGPERPCGVTAARVASDAPGGALASLWPTGAVCADAAAIRAAFVDSGILSLENAPAGLTPAIAGGAG